MSLAGDSWIIYWPTKLYLTVYSTTSFPVQCSTGQGVPNGRTRSQGQNVRVDQLLLEPGEIGLLPIKEAADRIDQNMVGRRCSQTTGLFE